MLKEFKEFAIRGNAIELAIGVIMATSFQPIVKSLVDDIIMPPIGWALGSIDFAAMKTVLGTNAAGEEVSIGWGLFINALIVFVVVIVGIYGGWANPTEAAAIGAAACGILAVVSGGMRAKGLVDSALGTAQATAMIRAP